MKQQCRTIYERVWLITGSSAGLGRALTEAVLARGERAVVTARTPEKVRDLIERYPAQALVLELDVNQQDQVRSVVREALERFGHIDVLANMDGFSEVLSQEIASLGITVISIEAGHANDHVPKDLAATANGIIATVDADSVKSAIR
jgi:NAD(P)-dependent dehydrogenase (short-subunit alcohol dehydrogenase family)